MREEYHLHFIKEIVLCVPWSEKLGRLPEVTQLGSIKERTGIHKVWQKILYFQWIFYSGAESLYREGRQEKAGREDGGVSGTFIWLLWLGARWAGGWNSGGYTFKERTLGGRCETSLKKERMEAGRPVGNPLLRRAWNEGQEEWKGKVRVGDYTERTEGGK